MHINVRPFDKSGIWETAQEAIAHVITHRKGWREWDMGGKKFGHCVDDIQKICAAIDAKNHAAFKAARRRGYWRVELA